MRLKLVKCSSPNCDVSFFVKHFKEDTNYFCKKCRRLHSLPVLEKQAEHDTPIKQLILDSRIMNNASGMADYIGISFVSMYNWIQKYFGMTFQEFRCEYICKTPSCYKVKLENFNVIEQEELLNKLKALGYCVCSNSLEKGTITTKAPPSIIARLLKERKKRKPIQDKTITYGKFPTYLKSVQPTYFNKK